MRPQTLVTLDELKLRSIDLRDFAIGTQAGVAVDGVESGQFDAIAEASGCQVARCLLSACMPS